MRPRTNWLSTKNLQSRKAGHLTNDLLSKGRINVWDFKLKGGEGPIPTFKAKYNDWKGFFSDWPMILKYLEKNWIQKILYIKLSLYFQIKKGTPRLELTFRMSILLSPFQITCSHVKFANKSSQIQIKPVYKNQSSWKCFPTLSPSSLWKMTENHQFGQFQQENLRPVQWSQ